MFSRRSFLKLATYGPASLGVSARGGQAESPVRRLARLLPDKGGLLPTVPKPTDLASDRLVHHFRDLFNPPEIQTHLGSLQIAKSISGITSIVFPPISCCGLPPIQVNRMNLVTCELFLNDQILTNYPGEQVAYTWYPHKVVRETDVEGLRVVTQTFMPSQEQAVCELIAVTNESGERRKITLGFDLRAGVTSGSGSKEPWRVATAAEADNRLIPLQSRGCIVFESRHTRAFSIQGISPHPDRIEQGRMLILKLSLETGETRTLQYVNVVGDQRDKAVEVYERTQSNFQSLMAKSEQDVASLIRSAFTPGNSDFSGHLPQLETSNASLWKLYYTGFLGILVSRRLPPVTAYSPVYLTIARLLPTLSFIWDTMLTSLSLSLLDPKALRLQIEVWLTVNMHEHLATDYLTGQGVGPWYGVNDLGILRCAHDYLRVTGDFKWLDKTIRGKTVMTHLSDHALYWKQLDKNAHGLADYGGLRNLLEVVSTYTHEVAALNAGNVYGMRFVAMLFERRGDTTRAAHLRSEAKELAARISRLLYVKGKGWWKCGQPDGSFNEVRHCYDLLTILDTMFEDLSDQQKKEMSSFFWDQLHTPLWMHALSPGDADATWAVRGDHSWLGAYTAWPSMTAKGLYKINPSPQVATWLNGLAKSANQGPFGQSQLVASVFPPDKGGALKTPPNWPYHNHWCELAGGNFTDMVIDSVFGADLTLYSGIRINSRLGDFDTRSRLLNVNYQGKRYTITRYGAEQAD